MSRSTAPRMRPRSSVQIGWDHWWNANKWLQLEKRNLLLHESRHTTPSAAAPALQPGEERARLITAALPALTKAVADSDAIQRAAACVALGKCGAPAAMPLLLQALKDGSSAVQRSALLGLGLLGRDEAAWWLISVASDDAAGRHCLMSAGAIDRDTRKVALLALGFLRGREAVPELERLARVDAGPEESLRACAVTALGMRGDAAHAPLLAALATDLNGAEVDRAAAAMALGKLGDSSPLVTRTLTGLLKDRASLVVQAAAAALASLDPQHEQAAIAAALGEVVNHHSDVQAQAHALMALAQLSATEGATLATQQLGRSGILEGFAPLALALASRGGPAATKARSALQAQCVAAREDAIRASCWTALGVISDADAPAAARALTDSGTAQERTGAVIALGLASNTAHAEAIERILQNESDPQLLHEAALALALAAPREEACRSLLRVLKDGTHPHVLAGCAFALGLCADEAALKELAQLSASGAQLTRGWAITAMGVALDAAPLSRIARLRANNLYWAEEPALRGLLQSL